MKAVGVVEATCEQIFELVMSMDGTRFEQVFPLSIRDTCRLSLIIYFVIIYGYSFKIDYT